SKRDETLFVLERFGVRQHFTAIITREEYTQPKPAPDAFLTAAAALGVEPQRCVVVEDTGRGGTAAAAAGCPAVAVPRDFRRRHAGLYARQRFPPRRAGAAESRCGDRRGDRGARGQVIHGGRCRARTHLRNDGVRVTVSGV